MEIGVGSCLGWLLRMSESEIGFSFLFFES